MRWPLIEEDIPQGYVMAYFNYRILTLIVQSQTHLSDLGQKPQVRAKSLLVPIMTLVESEQFRDASYPSLGAISDS